MNRFRASLASGAVLLSMLCLPVAFPSRAGATPDPSIDAACAGQMSPGNTFNLTADCDITVQLTVPDGQTVNGGGHIITAHDPGGGNFSGAVLTNAGSSMTIVNLTIEGTGFAVDCAVSSLMGIFFNNSSGTLSGVKVENITQHSGCPLGQAIRANSTDGVHRTVTLQSVVATKYQRSAFVASGTITANVTNSTFGPPDNLTGIISQNGVQYGGLGVNAGAGGTVADSTVYGSGFGMASDQSTAFLLFGASGVNLLGITFTGQGTDIGVAVTSNSTGVDISHNQIAVGSRRPRLGRRGGPGRSWLLRDPLVQHLQRLEDRHGRGIPATVCHGCGLLARCCRRWGVRLRGGALHGFGRQSPPGSAGRRDGLGARWRLLAGREGRRGVQLRSALHGLDGRYPAERADCRHRADSRRWRVLPGRS